MDHTGKLSVIPSTSRLGLPGLDPSGERPSFRVRGKIFATLWSEAALNAMPGEPEIHALAQGHPDVCTPVHWGRRLAAVQIHLPAADAALVADVLAEAWARRAPAALRARRGGAG